jgi:hypothetical protein
LRLKAKVASKSRLIINTSNRFKKEQKARCRVFEEWLAEYKKDESPNHKAFFAGYLKKNYEDFAAYRGVAESGGKCTTKSLTSKCTNDAVL